MMIDKLTFKPFFSLEDIAERWGIPISENGMIELEQILRLSNLQPSFIYNGELVEVPFKKSIGTLNSSDFLKLNKKSLIIKEYSLFINFKIDIKEVNGGIELISFYLKNKTFKPVIGKKEPVNSKGKRHGKVIRKIGSIFLPLSHAYISRAELIEFEARSKIQSKEENNPIGLSEREKGSYLKLIKSLALSYGIDLNKLKAKELGITIDDDQGFTISEGTIRKILKELKVT